MDASRNHDVARFDASRIMAKVVDRFSTYRRMAGGLLSRGVSPLQIMRTQYPLALPTASVPPIVTVALTNVCNLRCVYCTSPLHELERGFMTEETFSALLQSLRRNGYDRLRLVGNGEATLHPEFVPWIGALAESVRYLSIVTNGHWHRASRERIIEALALCDLVEVSVEGDRAESYESSRLGGDFRELLGNLSRLKEYRDASGAGTQINLRLMMRPSDEERKARLLDFWSAYGDCVMPQYVVQRPQLSSIDDVYQPSHRLDDSVPRCPLIFKDLGVEWNGTVPLCYMSATQSDSDGIILGNIRDHDLKDLWHHSVLRHYRRAHRLRQVETVPVCRGCTSA